MEDRYPQLRSFCLVVGEDAEAVETARSLIDAHPAALVTRDLDLFKEGGLRFQKRARFLRTLTGRLPANEVDDHQLIGTSGGSSTMRTLRQWPERLRELGDLLGVPVKVVSALRDGEVRAHHETPTRMEDHGVEVLHVRFEDLLRDVPEELTRLCRFLGLDAEWLQADRRGNPRVKRSWRTRSQGRPDGTESGLTEYFVDHARRADEPVLVFHHIQKTAGTSLRDLIRANLPPVERETRRYNHFLPMDVLLASFRRDLEEVAPERGAALRCVMSHRANFALPFIERPVVAVTIIREPVDRVVSAHYFSRSRSDPLDTMRRLTAIYTDRVGSELSPKAAFTYHNLQARSLLAPYYDPAELERTRGPGSDADLWRERLFTLVSERYTVGLKERLDDFVRELAARFGWEQTELARKKASSATRPRPAVSDLPEELQELIRDYNWLDLELYEHCRAELYGSAKSGGL